MIGYYNWSVVLTYVGLAAAIIGITFALQGDIRVAGMLIMVSSVCDMFDGQVARVIKRSEPAKRFGIQIDSLCDLVCFGVFPALIGYGLGIRGVIGTLAMIFFVLCGVIRLAYFNVHEEERQEQTSERRKYYQGLPITTSGALAPICLMLTLALGGNFKIVYTVFLFVVGLAFVIDFPVKKPHGVFKWILLIVDITIFVCICCFGGRIA